MKLIVRLHNQTLHRLQMRALLLLIPNLAKRPRKIHCHLLKSLTLSSHHKMVPYSRLHNLRSPKFQKLLPLQRQDLKSKIPQTGLSLRERPWNNKVNGLL